MNPKQIIVCFRSGDMKVNCDAVVNHLPNGKLLREPKGQRAVFLVDDAADVEKLAKEINGWEEVEYAEPDSIDNIY